MLDKFKQELAVKGEVYLRVKARPQAEQTKVREVQADDTVKLDVSAEPVKGKANLAIIKFLAKEFAVEKNNITIIAGLGEAIKLIKLVK